MEEVSMKADMRLQARSLACRPVGEHRRMAVVVMMMITMKMMMMKDGRQKDKRHGGKRDKNACWMHQPRSFYKLKIIKLNPCYLRDNVQSVGH